MRSFSKMLVLVFMSVAILSALWWFWPERTPVISAETVNSVARLDYISIGGLEQCVLTRGKNTNNPVLLFLHGGPGMPLMYLAHEFQRPLEQDFVVVQWDRRGAGKTYARNAPSAESMSIRQLLDDAYALVDTLKTRYDQDRIILVAHSFGTYLGSIMVTERPELFSAYVSIGQVVDPERARVLQEKFIRANARLDGRKEILTELAEPGSPNLENWLFEFGGELKHSRSFWPLVWSGLLAPEYSLPEVLKVSEGSSFSSSNMKYNVLSQSIGDEIVEYALPVYFIVGTSDYTTPYELVSEYYDSVKAPHKEILYFKNSAHFPFFEEPENFCREVKRLLLNEN